MGRFRIAFGVALIGLAAAGCAKVSAAPEQQRSSPSPSVTALGPPLSYAGTLAIGPQDSGTPISLGAGNTLTRGTVMRDSRMSSHCSRTWSSATSRIRDSAGSS
jgi:hypothetical protein